MWYPSQEQQQQHSWYGYAHYPSSQQQQQQTYLRSSYYCNDDELSTSCVVAINDENESSFHCHTTYDSNIHVTTPDCYVITSNNSYGDEMSSYQTITPTRKPYWSPVIAAPPKNMTIITPSPSSSSSSSSSSPSACWDWLLFSPQYYSEFYTPSSTYVHHQKKFEEEENDDINSNFLASLPTCLLALLYLTPKLIHTSDDENDSDQEIRSLHKTDESLLSSSSISRNNISSNLSLSSDNNKNKNLNLNIDGQKTKTNRSSTPDTDDGYQSASDVSRSDYSQQSSIHSDHHNSKDNITIPTPLMTRRLSYAAAVKPIITSTNKISLLSTPINKPKQTITNISTNDMLNSNGQKLKFTAPRFERMHHAKQYSSSSSSSLTTSSNRTQIRSINNNNNNNNNNQRNHIVNPTRRR